MGIALTSQRDWPICTLKMVESNLDAPSRPNNVGRHTRLNLSRAIRYGEDAHGR
jgi:hypothetical protein